MYKHKIFCVSDYACETVSSSVDVSIITRLHCNLLPTSLFSNAKNYTHDLHITYGYGNANSYKIICTYIT